MTQVEKWRSFLGSPALILFCLVVSIFAVLFMIPKTASAAPFTCSTDFYWVVDDTSNTQLYHGDPATGDLTNPLGPLSAVDGYNAIGYNSTDNHIWGLSTEGATEARLVRVEADGTVSMPYGTTPVGLPVQSYQAGTFDDSGNYWVQAFSGDFGNLYRINTATNTATTLPLSGAALPTTARIVDLAYVGGYLYTFSGGNTATDLRTYRIDPTTGQVTQSGPMTGMNLSGSGDFMNYAPALWSTSDGRIYTYYGQGTSGENGVYEILNYNDPNPQYVLRNNIDAPSSGDGASCINAASPFSIDAEPEDFSSNPINSCTGGIAGNVFTDDTLYGDSIDPADVDLTLVNDGGLSGVNLQPNGDVVVPAGCKPPGPYTVVYRICDVANPDICDESNVTVHILGASTSNPSGLSPTGQSVRAILLNGIAVITGSIIMAGTIFVLKKRIT